MGRQNIMSRLAAWKVGVIATAFVAWPLIAASQTNPQTGNGQQPPPAGGQTQGTAAGQPPQGQGQPGGNPQSQGTDSQRQAALARLTAARQDLADVTRLPAATRLEGQPRSDLNQLISNFNALITSTGPEWRQAYDRVQANLTALLGPAPEQAGQESAPPASAQSAVGTSGTTAPSLDPAIAAKLSDMRQQIDQFGQTVGVKPGQSAVAQGQSAPGGQADPAGTSGSAPNEQALRDIDQIGAIVSRLLSGVAPDQASISVNRQDLQQIQDYLNRLRQAVGQQPIR